MVEPLFTALLSGPEEAFAGGIEETSSDLIPLVGKLFITNLKLNLPHDLQQQSRLLLLPATFATRPLVYQLHCLVFQDALLLLENGGQLLPLLFSLAPWKCTKFCIRMPLQPLMTTINH